MPMRNDLMRLHWLCWLPLAVAALIAAALLGAGRGTATGLEPVTVGRWPAALLLLALGGVAAGVLRYALTARRAACEYARRLVESQAASHAVLETAVEGIITINEQGIVESFNPAAERIFGYAADEVIGRNVKMLMPAPECDLHDGYLSEHLRTGESKGIGLARERRGRRKDGTVFPLEVAVSEIHLPERRVFAGICHDISERKRAEAALAASRSFLQTVIDGIPDAVMVIDREYRVVLANRAVREAAGGKDPVASLLTCYQASHQVDAPCDGEHTCPLERVIATRAPVTVTHTHRDDAGNDLFVEIIAAPILDQRGEVVQVIEASRNITARVRAEHQARQRQAELAHLSRLGTMGAMAAGLAHELNQPLSAIVNYTQACLERIRAGAADPANLLEDLEEVGVQAERAGDIIEYVRSFVRKADPQRCNADLNELVREAIGLLRMEIRHREIELRIDLCKALPATHVVPIQIVQVIVNLVQNALDAMSDPHNRPRRLSISTGTNGNRSVELAIGDTGVGLPATDTERLFDPFFTTKPDGIGLGLAMCRSIIETHGGHISARPGDAGGATIRLTLPAVNGHGDEAR